MSAGRRTDHGYPPWFGTTKGVHSRGTPWKRGEWGTPQPRWWCLVGHLVGGQGGQGGQCSLDGAWGELRSKAGPITQWVGPVTQRVGPITQRVDPVTQRVPPAAAAMASQLEGAMETLINVFHHYSGKEGDKYKLSKKELKELLQSELGCFLEVGAALGDTRGVPVGCQPRGSTSVVRPPPPQTQKDTGAVEKIMQDLDENGDGEVDFQEYVVLVAALTVACNTFFWENA